MSASAAPSAPIANRDLSPIELTRYEAVLIVVGRINRHNGRRLVFVQFPTGSAEHREFLHGVLQLTVAQYRHHRADCEGAGRCDPAVIVGDWQTMLRTVATTPGAVGYFNDYKVEWDQDDSGVGVARVRILR